MSVIGLGSLYLIHMNNLNQTATNAASAAATATTAANNAAATATANANATATANAQTPAATATTAPSPTPSPSPITSPTVTADPNYTFCGQLCLSNGFETEFPNGWNQLRSGDGLSIQFMNPDPVHSDQFATFKTPATTPSSANDVVAYDLNYYFNKPGFTASPNTSAVTISGETWMQSIATYQGSPQQGDMQKERIEVFGIIHNGKSYVIELNAPDSYFDSVNAQYFVNMTGRFQFQQ
jgi:hypothetical protein